MCCGDVSTCPQGTKCCNGSESPSTCLPPEAECCPNGPGCPTPESIICPGNIYVLTVDGCWKTDFDNKIYKYIYVHITEMPGPLSSDLCLVMWVSRPASWQLSNSTTIICHIFFWTTDLSQAYVYYYRLARCCWYHIFKIVGYDWDEYLIDFFRFPTGRFKSVLDVVKLKTTVSHRVCSLLFSSSLKDRMLACLFDSVRQSFGIDKIYFFQSHFHWVCKQHWWINKKFCQ